MSHPSWVLGTELCSFARTVCTALLTVELALQQPINCGPENTRDEAFLLTVSECEPITEILLRHATIQNSLKEVWVWLKTNYTLVLRANINILVWGICLYSSIAVEINNLSEIALNAQKEKKHRVSQSFVCKFMLLEIKCLKVHLKKTKEIYCMLFILWREGYHNAHVGYRGKLARGPCGPQDLNSGHQTWRQNPFAHWATLWAFRVVL